MLIVEKNSETVVMISLVSYVIKAKKIKNQKNQDQETKAMVLKAREIKILFRIRKLSLKINESKSN